MGCRQGKQKSAANGPENLDTIPEPSTPPPVDPRLPINARQVFKLKKSWKGIKRNMEATGVEMFIRLFRNNNELISLFKDFKDITSVDDITRENEALEHHALLVMSVIDEAICHIDEVDRVIELCTRVGATHSRFTGFTSDLFWNMEEPFLASVKLILGDRYSDSMDVIYQLTIKFILSNLTKGFKAASS
uniref:Globin gb_IIC n=1 Tax=Platynereis dumerilii TaxID=6359 RepID=A0A7T8HUJ6_PLADU|nr:globin gb_IIC [Platynereis dumerilii]